MAGIARTNATTRATDKGDRLLNIENRAHALAARLPDLMLEARRVALTVEHGIHGRHRAGPGETFWQFRQYQNEDAVGQIDWRRSASSDHLYIREREWEAAHTIWLWSDLSPSMDFRSKLANTTKGDRALTLMFALGEMMVRGGERVAILGMMPPTAHRQAIQRMAQAVLEDAEESDQSNVSHNHKSLPPQATLSRFSEVIFLSDFLEPVDKLESRLSTFAAQGVKGHLLQIFDPAEETLPYEGRTLFEAAESGDRMLAERAEELRDAYATRLEEHRNKIRDLMRKLEWSFTIHHTDRPAEEALLALHTRISGSASDFRHHATGQAKTKSANLNIEQNSKAITEGGQI